MRTYIKSVYAAIESNDKEAATSAYHSAVSIIDRNAKRGLHHKNKSARLKSRMNKRIMAMAWWSNTSNKKKYKKSRPDGRLFYCHQSIIFPAALVELKKHEP